MALEDAKNPIKGVSGPGKYAKRTDRIPSNFYGDQKQIADIASGASIKSTPVVTPSQAPEVPVEPTPVTPLYAETTRKNEPITAGIDMGAGPGSEALMMKSRFAQAKLSDTLAQMLPYDETGEVAVLYQQALSRGM